MVSKNEKMGLRHLALLVSLLVLSLLGCKARDSRESYKEKAGAVIERSYKKLSDFTRKYAALEKGFQGLDASSESESQKQKYYRYGVKKYEYSRKVFLSAANELRRIAPPPEYKEGHLALIRVYELYVESMRISVKIFESKLLGEDTSSLEKQDEELANEILPFAEKAHKFQNRLGVGPPI